MCLQNRGADLMSMGDSKWASLTPQECIHFFEAFAHVPWQKRLLYAFTLVHIRPIQVKRVKIECFAVITVALDPMIVNSHLHASCPALEGYPVVGGTASGRYGLKLPAHLAPVPTVWLLRGTDQYCTFLSAMLLLAHAAIRVYDAVISSCHKGIRHPLNAFSWVPGDTGHRSVGMPQASFGT